VKIANKTFVRIFGAASSTCLSSQDYEIELRFREKFDEAVYRSELVIDHFGTASHANNIRYIEGIGFPHVK
jgi:hypothetical protein